MVETRAELPFIGDQVVCLSHDQAGGEAGRKESAAVFGRTVAMREKRGLSSTDKKKKADTQVEKLEHEVAAIQQRRETSMDAVRRIGVAPFAETDAIENYAKVESGLKRYALLFDRIRLVDVTNSFRLFRAMNPNYEWVTALEFLKEQELLEIRPMFEIVKMF